MCKIEPCINSDIYADGMCYYHYKYGAEKPAPEKKVYVIPKESKKRKEQNKIDQAQNKKILKERPACEMKLPGCTGKAQGAQHTEGRIGKRLTDETKKLAACNWCNGLAERKPLDAQAAGVSKSRIKKV